MIKFVDTKIVFAEIPDEITLAINISNCPNHCKNCHSKYLWEDIGTELSYSALCDLIKANYGISCICFMGGDSAPNEIISLKNQLRKDYPLLKIGWYSGKTDFSLDSYSFDYIKLGPYIEDLGPLTNKNTNQRLYSYDNINKQYKDITYKFWNEKI